MMSQSDVVEDAVWARFLQGYLPQPGDLVVHMTYDASYIWLGKLGLFDSPGEVSYFSAWHLETANEAYLRPADVIVIHPFSECVDVDA